MKKFIPFIAPGSCTLLISRAIRITYGNRAVKYTTYKQRQTSCQCVHQSLSLSLSQCLFLFPYLACWFHPLEDAKVNEDPGQDENKEKLPADRPCFFNSASLTQHLISSKKPKKKRKNGDIYCMKTTAFYIIPASIPKNWAHYGHKQTGRSVMESYCISYCQLLHVFQYNCWRSRTKLGLFSNISNSTRVDFQLGRWLQCPVALTFHSYSYPPTAVTPVNE